MQRLTQKIKTLKMGTFIALQAVTALALLVSILGAGENFSTQEKWVLALSGIFLITYSIKIEYAHRNAEIPEYEVFEDNETKTWKVQVREYMQGFLERGGRSVIFTRDMSWVKGDAKEILEKKAKNNELQIFMESPTPISQNLSRQGADISYYGNLLDESINTRFTIINVGSNSAEIAIGKTYNKSQSHRIHIISDPKDPAFSLAEDYLALAKKVMIKADETPKER